MMQKEPRAVALGSLSFPPSHVIHRCPDAALPSAVGTAEERALSLDPVTDKFAPAVIANRSQLVDGTLEAIERMGVTGGNDLEGEIVIVAADFTSSHRHLLAGAAPCHPVQEWPRGLGISRSERSGSSLLYFSRLEPLGQIRRPGAEEFAGRAH